VIPDVAQGTQIATMSGESIDQVRRLESALLSGPQVEITTSHALHAGMYARTVHIPAGVVLTGALIKLATVLIVSGDVSVFIGGETLRLTGYHVIPAGAGRKQAFIAHADTHLTMLFPSQATTVEQAESEFTDESDLLLSRQDAKPPILITGD
jgi:hypothetical protein